MAFRAFLFVALAIFAFWFIGPSEQYDSEEDDDDYNTIDNESQVCKSKIETSDGVLEFTKDCLGYSKESMDCVREFMEKREKDPFPIAVECTPNMPETLKQILRELRRIMNEKREVESRCKMDYSTACSNELLTIKKKHDEMMDGYLKIRETLNGPAKIADEKFTRFVLNVAGIF